MFEHRRTIHLHEDIAQLGAIPDSGEDNRALRNRYRRFLAVAVRHLPPHQRQAALLYYFEGKKQREIAGLLGIDRSTVSRRLKHARESLKHLADIFSETGLF